MKLYELCSAIIISGDIALNVFDEEGNKKETRIYRHQTDFDTITTDAFELEDTEVTNIYTSVDCDCTQWLVIDVMESHEV